MGEALVNKSRFLVPYYTDKKYKKIFGKGWDENGKTAYLKELLGARTDSGWGEEKRIETKFLASYIKEYLNGKKKICHYFSMEVGRKIIMSSTKTGQKFQFILKGVETYHFDSGSGCLVFAVEHMPEDSLEVITDKCQNLSRIFEKEHDSGSKENELEFFFDENGACGTSFSMKNLILDLLHVEGNDRHYRVFSSGMETRCATYHQIVFESKDSFPRHQAMLRNLARSLPSNASGDEEDLSAMYAEFSTVKNTHWEICSMGAAVVTYVDREAANHKFLEQFHRENSELWYFTLFMIDYAERETLLFYNSQVAEEWKKVKKLEKIRKKILRFNLWFGYGTVSIESSYQFFHEQLRDVFRLDKLENEITDMIESVKNYEESVRSRRTEIPLITISFLAIFSALIDGADFIARIYRHDMGDQGYMIFFCSLGVVIIFVIVLIIKTLF